MIPVAAGGVLASGPNATQTPGIADLRYVAGDATAPGGNGFRIIMHVCNDKGGWGRGFVVALSKRWPEVEASYRAWAAGKTNRPFGLGRTQFVDVNDGIIVANMVAQHDTRPKDGVPPIRYAALGYCLETVAKQALAIGATVHCPRIGAGLAGGEWSRIELLIRAHLVTAGVDVTVYDLP